MAASMSTGFVSWKKNCYVKTFSLEDKKSRRKSQILQELPVVSNDPEENKTSVRTSELVICP